MDNPISEPVAQTVKSVPLEDSTSKKIAITLLICYGLELAMAIFAYFASGGMKDGGSHGLGYIAYIIIFFPLGITVIVEKIFLVWGLIRLVKYLKAYGKQSFKNKIFNILAFFVFGNILQITIAGIIAVLKGPQ